MPEGLGVVTTFTELACGFLDGTVQSIKRHGDGAGLQGLLNWYTENQMAEQGLAADADETRLGSYTVTAKIGEGGMGEVIKRATPSSIGTCLGPAAVVADCHSSIDRMAGRRGGAHRRDRR